MTIVAILFAAGAFGELYVALGEPSAWATLSIALVMVLLSQAAARKAVAEAAAVTAIASRSQQSAIRAISQRIAYSLSIGADRPGHVVDRWGRRLNLAPSEPRVRTLFDHIQKARAATRHTVEK